MYPIVFRFRDLDFPISTFGVMLAIAFLIGTWITALRMREEGLDPELATTLLIYVMLGGILGSKLYYAIDVSLREGIPFTSLLFARDGITWYGGLIGGDARRRARLPHPPRSGRGVRRTACGGGRGRPGARAHRLLPGRRRLRARSRLPWAVAFPQGAPPTLRPVHPTQLYETVWLLGVAALLWRRRRKSPFLFGEYLVLNGLGRIAIELLARESDGRARADRGAVDRRSGWSCSGAWAGCVGERARKQPRRPEAPAAAQPAPRGEAQPGARSSCDSRSRIDCSSLRASPDEHAIAFDLRVTADPRRDPAARPASWRSTCSLAPFQPAPELLETRRVAAAQERVHARRA